jgi:adenylate cyclase
MPEQSNPTGAVFISYASQDADAAGRISEALRATGIEVWLDQSTLRAGDAWDAQIRKQIHDCALFLPVISAHTNERTEGYFRREWKLATRRLLDIADDAAFLVPVVIDGTREIDARVPEEFLNAQWMRLPGGQTPPAFAERVRQLLGGAGATEHAMPSTIAVRNATRAQGVVTARAGDASRTWRVKIALTALLLVLVGGVFSYIQGTGDAPAKQSEPDPALSIAAAASNMKSIAVLPFTDMSAEKDQEYMADGIAEELLSLLAQVPDLKVIARTSSFAFKGQQIEVAEIAKRLNVAHVLEGSVRKSGNKLRITAQLIRAADSTELWSERYDRPLDDIFAVQDEIAGAIVQALRIRLLTTVSSLEGGTENFEAYQLYLQAVSAFNLATHESQDSAERLLKQAIMLDPNYGRAWSRLGWVAYMSSLTGDKVAIDAYKEARQSAERALQLSPQLADAHALLQVVLVQADKDWAAAEAEGKEALALDPTNPEVLFGAGWFASIQRRYEEGERMYRKALERDPLNFNLVDGIAENYYRTGRLADAKQILSTHIEREPRSEWSRAMLSRVLLVQGKADVALATLREEVDEGARIAYLPIMLQANGRQSDSDAAMKELVAYWGDGCAICIARAYAYRGDKDRALDWLDRAHRMRDSSIMNVIDEPLMKSLADDPRYKAFVRDKLKLPS